MDEEKERKIRNLEKSAFYAIGVLVVFIFIVASYFWNLKFSDDVDWAKWGANLVFLGSIGMAMRVLGEGSSKEFHMSREYGLYQETINHFDDSMKKIEPFKIFFDQFFFWEKQKELFQKKVDYLVSHRFSGLEAVYIVRYVTQDDLEILAGPIAEEKKLDDYDEEKVYGKPVKKIGDNGKEITIRAIPQSKACYVQDILDGKIKVLAAAPQFYLQVENGKNRNLTMLEKSPDTDTSRATHQKLWYVYSAISIVVFSLIFAFLVVDTSAGAGTSEAIWNLIKRLGSAVLGYMSGWTAGNSDIKMLCRSVLEKIVVQDCFFDSYTKKIFIPKSYEEMAREEAEEEAKKEEEARSSVVIPDVLKEAVKNQPLQLEGGK